MYTAFYGLSRMPFQLTPDSTFFFGSAEHERAMAFLNYGISQGEGFVVVTGEVGAGKTTLVDHLLSTLDQSHYVAGRIVTTQLSSYDMLRMVAASFQLFREGMDKASLLNRLVQFMSELHGHSKRAILIVDEAQSLSREAVEELRMLSNLSAPGAPPLQSILLGQPEFRAVLASPDLEQMRQRVIASCHLGALTAEDTRRYVEHRLKRAGWSGSPTFSDGAFGQIFRFTGGVPRRINTLCSRLLLLGFLEERRHFTEEVVISVAAEMEAEVGPLPGAATRGMEPTLTSSRSDEHLAYIRELRDLRQDVVPRMARLEQKMDQHETALHRALDLAMTHLPLSKLR